MNATLTSGETILSRAAMEGHLEILKFLAGKGASINTQETASRYTPLHWAVRSGNLEMVQFLVEKGAGLTVKNVDGKTPYDMARDAGNEAMMEILK